MTAVLAPQLAFPGTARAAMEFYREVFGGSLRVATFGEGGDPEGPDADLVMHARLDTPAGFVLVAGDVPTGVDWVATDAVSLHLSGDDPRLWEYWDRLSVTGTVTAPLSRQPWGDDFGMCVDRFGVPWVVNLTPPE